MKKYDENQALRSVSRVAKINVGTKTIQLNKAAIVGIHTWGKIDYLVKYHKYSFVWDNGISIKPDNTSEENNANKKDIKRAAKAPKLSNKTKRTKKLQND